MAALVRGPHIPPQYQSRHVSLGLDLGHISSLDRGAMPFLSKHKPAPSSCFLPLRDRRLGFFAVTQITFFKCSPAILHSDKDLKIQVTLRIVILTAQVSKQQSTGQYNETGLSDSSEVSIKFQSLSQQYWQAR